jgi:hypothetical protein
MALTEFANTRDPFMTFRWTAYQLPFNLDPRYVEKVSIPWPRFESIPIYGSGTNNYYHSVQDVDPITVTFYEDAELTITKMLLQWRELIQTDGYYGLPVDYKKNLGFYLLGTTDDTALMDIQAQGAWPSSIENFDLAYDASERLPISVTFTIDSLIIKPTNSSSGSGLASRTASFQNQLSSIPRYGGSSSSDDIRTLLGLTSSNSSTNSIITDVSTDNNGWSISTSGKTSVNSSGWSSQDSAVSGYRADENTNTSTGFSFSTVASTDTVNAGSVVVESYSPDDTSE